MSAKPIVLVVEGTPSEGETLSSVLDSPQYHTVFVDSPEDALAHVESPIDLVLSRVGPDNPLGRDLLQRWKARRPGTPYVLMTDAADTPSAREAVELGAAGLITLPSSRSEISAQILKWLDYGREPESKQSNGNSASGLHQPRSTVRSELSTSIRIPPGTTLEDLERVAVEQALEQHHGNRTHAAKELGISVRTLQRKLKAWGEMRGTMGEPGSPMREPSARNGAPSRPWNGNPAAPRQANPSTYRPRLATV